jgi:hypothetical protein
VKPSLIGLIIFVSFSLHAQDAASLNRAGWKEYRARNFVQALDLFEKAWTADPSLAVAHYNWACTAAILYRGNVCEYLHLRSAIFTHLKRAIELKPAYQKKIVQDNDLSAIRGEYRFWLLTGKSPSDPADLRHILTHCRWFGPQPGTALISRAAFRDDKTMTYELLYISEDGSYMGYKPLRARWSVSGADILLDFDTPIKEKKQIRAIFRDGTIEFPDDELPPLSTDEDPCSA